MDSIPVCDPSFAYIKDVEMKCLTVKFGSVIRCARDGFYECFRGTSAIRAEA